MVVDALHVCRYGEETEDDLRVFWSGLSTFSLHNFINQPELVGTQSHTHTQVWDLALVVFPFLRVTVSICSLSGEINYMYFSSRCCF